MNIRTVVSWLLGALSLAIGFRKLGDGSAWGPLFAHWGFPPSARFVVGAAEMLGAALLLVPALRKRGAVALLTIMLGAISTHLLHGEFARVAPPLLIAAALAWVAVRTR